MGQEMLFITLPDMRRLRQLVECSKWFLKREVPRIQVLEAQLDRAVVVQVERIQSDVVTVNSQVCVKELDVATEAAYTLVFPPDADVKRNRISILAPLGTALLGRSAGHIIATRTASGRRRLEVKKILYQPGAAADEALSGISNARDLLSACGERNDPGLCSG